MKTLLSRLLLLGAALLLAACGTFDRQWKAAPAATKQDPFVGQWEGRWQSAGSANHGGKLQCVLSPAGPNRYRADFRAHWASFASSYTVVFETQRRGGKLLFRGEKDLGALYGGVYRYEGSATPERLVSTYASSAAGNGIFDLTRVSGTGAGARH